MEKDMKLHSRTMSQFFDSRRSRLSLIFLVVLVTFSVLIFVAVKRSAPTAERMSPPDTPVEMRS
jgi:hypothetical protein